MRISMVSATNRFGDKSALIKIGMSHLIESVCVKVD